MSRVAVAVIFSLWANTAHANDSTACVQSFLALLGYNVGTVDGLLGPRTGAAAQAYLDDTAADLPPLARQTAAEWCAHARNDQRYQLLTAHNSFGILPQQVFAAALQADSAERNRACGSVSRQDLERLERQTPIHRISGFNSRMDNFEAVPGAEEAESFAGRFGQASVAAFARKDNQARTRLVRVLAKWARNDAFLGTISCVQPDGNLLNTGECVEWRQPDGQDLSGKKDHSMTTMLMAGLVRTYLALLADHERNALAEDHAAIDDWATNGFAPRLKRPSDVYFGLNMGWYWPAINLAMAKERTGNARRLLLRLERGLSRKVNRDGSIVDRTTRGDRALWYQFTSIGEIVVSLEMLRAAGLAPDRDFEDRLHAAVDLFLRATDDYSVLHPWASQRHNSSYKGETQDWDRNYWPNHSFGGSWLHIYPARYPDHPNSAALRRKVPWSARSATSDIDFGFGAGCLYNLASGRVSNRN